MTTSSQPCNDNPADLNAIDILFDAMMALNGIDPDNEHGGDVRYATAAEGAPYWHVERALLQAAAHLLGGNQRRAEELVSAMIRDGEPVREVLPRVREQWVSNDPVYDTVQRMIMGTEEKFEADVVRWAAVRAGLLWYCADRECGHASTSTVDACEACGKARPVPA